MKKLIERIVGWWSGIKHKAAMKRLSKQWEARGHPFPLIGAMEEARLRVLLEEFRDWASDRYILKRELVDDIKEEWIKSTLRPMTSSIGMGAATMVRKAIREMPVSEVFHADTYEIWLKDSKNIDQQIGRSHQNISGRKYADRFLRVIKTI
jgi:hypothetical protein